MTGHLGSLEVRRNHPSGGKEPKFNPASPGEKQAMEMTEYGKHGKPRSRLPTQGNVPHPARNVRRDRLSMSALAI